MPHNLASKISQIAKPGFSNRLGAKKRLLRLACVAQLTFIFHFSIQPTNSFYTLGFLDF
jgi:hypothetical protein